MRMLARSGEFVLREGGARFAWPQHDQFKW